MKQTKLFALAIVLSLASFAFGANRSQPAAPQWEYKFEYKCDEKKANALAVDGWELVNMGVASFGSLAAVHCAFKRPKN